VSALRVLAAAAALVWCAGASAQDSRPASAPASVPASAPTLDRLADRANHQSPYLSAQGVKALKTQGPAAVAALERFVARRSILALAPLVVEWLGELPEDDRARAMLRSALADRQFPWRPQASKALAMRPRPTEIDLLLALAKDPLPAVREPALIGLGDLGSRETTLRPRALAALEAALADPMFEPRLAACEALVRLGEKPPPLLYEALGVERRFFDLDFGVLARRRAWAALEPVVGKGTGYDPAVGRVRNATALAEVARRLGRAPESRPSFLPPDVDDAIFGLEVRSCRAGDQWVGSRPAAISCSVTTTSSGASSIRRPRASSSRRSGARRRLRPRAGRRRMPFSAGRGVISKSGTCPTKRPCCG
jgi:hypothetical protein